jgi:hypothetical protein
MPEFWTLPVTNFVVDPKFNYASTQSQTAPRPHSYAGKLRTLVLACVEDVRELLCKRKKEDIPHQFRR